MLISEPFVGSVHRLFVGKAFLQAFLNALNREMKLGNPTKHVSIAAAQVHELLEAVQEHIGCAPLRRAAAGNS